MAKKNDGHWLLKAIVGGGITLACSIGYYYYTQKHGANSSADSPKNISTSVQQTINQSTKPQTGQPKPGVKQ